MKPEAVATCYSAQIRHDYVRFVRTYGAVIDIGEFARLYLIANDAVRCAHQIPRALGATDPVRNSIGKVVMDFNKTFWSPGYGSLVDRFGVPWLVKTIPAGR